MPPKFTPGEEQCGSYDAICRCDEADRYLYLKNELLKLTSRNDMKWGGDDVRAYIAELLKEVDK